MSNPQTFTLKFVTDTIQSKIEAQFPTAFWVKAEMNKLGFNPFSKHAYPELVEKENGKIVAQMSATLFAKTFQSVNQKFLQVINEPLKEGITALLYVKIQYSALYGLSLNILDIDPSYTLGELEKERLETIKKLKEEGIFDQNKKLPLPRLLQRLAVISGEGTQGFSDFMSVLTHNERNYAFHTEVFSAVMQGDAAIPSILGQLQRIQRQQHDFDAVVIIRGGGGNVGMTCYNAYELARAVSLFPLPVFTGIGHSTNEFVTDLVAHQTSITPTGMATWIVHHMQQTEEELWNIQSVLSGEVLERLRQASATLHEGSQKLQRSAQQWLKSEYEYRQRVVERLDHKVRLCLQEAHWDQKRRIQEVHFKSQAFVHRQIPKLTNLMSNLKLTSQQRIQEMALKLETMGESVRLSDPQWILKRGYSITTDSQGNIITDLDTLVSGDRIKTQFADGSIASMVEKIQKNSNSNPRK